MQLNIVCSNGDEVRKTSSSASGPSHMLSADVAEQQMLAVKTKFDQGHLSPLIPATPSTPASQNSDGAFSSYHPLTPVFSNTSVSPSMVSSCDNDDYYKFNVRNSRNFSDQELLGRCSKKTSSESADFSMSYTKQDRKRKFSEIVEVSFDHGYDSSDNSDIEILV